MKRFNEVLEFFTSFPKSEFDANSVIAAITGKNDSSQVRNCLNELTTVGLVSWRWKEHRTGAKKVYRLAPEPQAPESRETPSHSAREENQCQTAAP